MEFDPYHKWLGIPAAEQPPNHYRLLGITRFENDADVIEAAADQRMVHLRTFQTGQYSAWSQQLLNEVAAARLCLLTPEQKLAYDADLRLGQPAPEPREPTVPRSLPVAVPPLPATLMASLAVEIETPTVIVTDDESPRGAARRRRTRKGPAAAAWLALAAVAVPAFAVATHMVWSRAEPGPTIARSESSAKAESPDSGAKLQGPSRTEPDVAPGGLNRFAYEIPDPNRSRWSIDGRQLVQNAFYGQADIFFGDPTWQDIDVSVELQRTEGPGEAGLWFGYQDDWNANCLWVGTNRKRDSVVAFTGGIGRELASRGGTIDAGRWYRVSLQLRGKSGKCYLDDEEILAFETERPPRGRIGLHTFSSRFAFRNIVVRSPEGTLLMEGLPELDLEPQPKAYEAQLDKLLASRGGELPAAADGRPLNLDFETGDLRDWTAAGDAFASQPVKGDALHARYKYLRSRHAGRFWLGGNEQECATGTLTSAPFKVTKPYASFLMAGVWAPDSAYVELVRSDSNETIFRATGRFMDSLSPIGVDLREHLGEHISVRILDRNNALSGHISFDDFRLHDSKPDFSPPFSATSSAAEGTTINVLKLVDIERDRLEGRWHWDADGFLAGIDQRLCQLPLAIPDEYNLALTIEGAPRTHEMQLNLPVGGRIVQLVLDGWGFSASGLRCVDGKDANVNETTHKGRVLLDGRPNDVICQVRGNSIKVNCNGSTVIDWRGNPARLAITPGIDAVAGYNGVLVGGPWGNFRISRIELTPNLSSEDDKADPSMHLSSVKLAPAAEAFKMDKAKLPLGRYVRIELPRTGTISLAEVEVYSGGRNVARSGKATQKNTGYGGHASRGIDGNTSGVWNDGGATHTGDNVPEPWWEVDLGGVYPLENIVVHNRTDNEFEKWLDGFTLLVLDAARKVVAKRMGIPAPEPSARFEVGDLAAELQSPQTAKLTAKEACSLNGHKGAVTRVKFHRTLPLLASAGKDGRILLWDLKEKGKPADVHEFREEVWAVKFNPDGSLLAFANRQWWGSRLQFKTLAGQQLNEVKDFKNGGGAVASIAYSPDGRLLAAGQDDGTIRLWDVAQLAEYPPVGLGANHNVYNLAFGPVARDRKRQPTGYLLAEGGKDGEVRTLAVSLLKNKNASRWTFQTTAVKFPKLAPVLGLRFSPDGKLLGVSRSDGNVALYDPLQGGPPVRVLAQGRGFAEWIAFHPRKPWCVSAHREEQVARIWHIETAELLCELKGHTGGVLCAEFSPDGRQVATASEDLSIKLWDLSGSDVPAAGARIKNPNLAPLVVGE